MNSDKAVHKERYFIIQSKVDCVQTANLVWLDVEKNPDDCKRVKMMMKSQMECRKKSVTVNNINVLINKARVSDNVMDAKWKKAT